APGARRLAGTGQATEEIEARRWHRTIVHAVACREQARARVVVESVRPPWFLLALAVCGACAPPRVKPTARPPERRTITHALAPPVPAASASAAPGADKPWLRPYRERCGSLEGDPRQWVARPPADGDGWFMLTRFSSCTWDVARDERGIGAHVAIPEKVALTLPMRVDTH